MSEEPLPDDAPEPDTETSDDDNDVSPALVLSRQEFLGLVFALLYADVITEMQATYYAYGCVDYGVPPYGGAIHFGPEAEWQE